MNPFAAFKVANSLDFEKLGAAIPVFILNKIRAKFHSIKQMLDKKLVEDEARIALLLYEDEAGKLRGLWVTLDKEGFTKRKLMLQDIEGLAQVESGGDILSLLPEILASTGQKLPDQSKTEAQTPAHEIKITEHDRYEQLPETDLEA